MESRVTLWKEVGATPLETVEAWRRLHPAYEGIQLSYAGRLDPMAEGKLLVLIGDECKRQAVYAKLDKEYEIEVLLGIESDTGDLLGIPSKAETIPDISLRTLTRILKKECGTKQVPYPAFSSKTVAGKPLFMHALEGSLATITLPVHDERIYRITLLEKTSISAADLLHHTLEKIARVSFDADPRKTLGADFRRSDIRAAWQALGNDAVSYPLIRLRVTAGSGTYMRSLAARIGKALGTEALAYAITRTKIGRYDTHTPLKFWWRTY